MSEIKCTAVILYGITLLVNKLVNSCRVPKKKTTHTGGLDFVASVRVSNARSISFLVFSLIRQEGK